MIAQGLLDNLQELNNEVFGTIDEVQPDQWTLVSGKEGWPLPLVVWHIGHGYHNTARWIKTLLEQQPITTTLDDINQFNDASAEKHASVKPDEATDYLRGGIQKMEDTLNGLTQAQLESSTPMALTDGPVTPETLVTILAGHTRGHLKHIQQTVAKEDTRN